MSLFGWFDTKEVDEFARSIAGELVKRVPPSALQERDDAAARRLKNTHQAVFSRAEQFAREHPLNMYKKARLGNQFRWELKEAGYPGQFVRSWTYELVTLLTLATTRKEPGR
jgi:hypothetical protein